MKVSALYAYFSSIFQNNENDMSEIHVTENGVLKLLKDLNISKAAGPDGIRPRVLKELSSELAPILTLLFKASLHQQSLPDIGNMPVLAQFIRREIRQTRPTIVLCL